MDSTNADPLFSINELNIPVKKMMTPIAIHSPIEARTKVPANSTIVL